MSTCFIFFDAIDIPPDGDLPESLFAVRLDETGEVDSALSAHTIEDIRAMQRGARTIIVLPVRVASIHYLNLPKLSNRKAREAIPYALEEVIAEPVQDIDVKFLRDKANPECYQVAVFNKRRLNTWIQVLEALALHFDVITLDWCALGSNEVCVCENDVLTREGEAAEAVNGALDLPVADAYLKNHENKSIQKIFVFEDSANLSHQILDLKLIEKQTGSYRLFLATRLLKTKFFVIAEGARQHKTEKKIYVYWQLLCLGLLGGLFLSILGVKALSLYQLNKQKKHLDSEIKVLYQTFFPEAEDVIYPRFRVQQLLKKRGESGHFKNFWMILNAWSKIASKHALDTISLAFKDNSLTVCFRVNTASVLDIKKQLENADLAVTEKPALNRHGDIILMLEPKS